MSSFDRRTLLIGFAAVLGGCGFTPLYREGGGASALVGAISLQEAADPEGFAYRERLRRRLRDGGDGARFGLSWGLRMTERGVAVTEGSDITRYQVTGVATWRLIELETGDVVDEGSVRTNGAYDATAAPYATLAAQRDERARIATELAELTATRLLATAEADPS